MREAPAPPVGVIESLSRGFEVVSSHLYLILLPLLLDLFLWAGPRLSIESLVQQMVVALTPDPGTDAAVRQNMELLVEQLTIIGREVNLFSIVSTAPLGLPSLMKARVPLAAPIGPVLIVPVNSPLSYLLVLITFYLTGLLLGAVYMGLIARQFRETLAGPSDWALEVMGNWARFLVITLLMLLALVALGLPLMALMVLLGMLAPVLTRIALVAGLAIVLWSVMYMSFTPHGVVLGRQGVLAALWDSIRMVQWNLPATVGLFSLMVALSWGLNYVWNLPQDDSWYLLLGVAGHAYIATALLTASFIFYQDRYRWWREARAQLIARLQSERKQAGEQK